MKKTTTEKRPKMGCTRMKSDECYTHVLCVGKRSLLENFVLFYIHRTVYGFKQELNSDQITFIGLVSQVRDFLFIP